VCAVLKGERAKNIEGLNLYSLPSAGEENEVCCMGGILCQNGRASSGDNSVIWKDLKSSTYFFSNPDGDKSATVTGGVDNSQYNLKVLQQYKEWQKSRNNEIPSALCGVLGLGGL
jgi:hypothetical protein